MTIGRGIMVAIIIVVLVAAGLWASARFGPGTGNTQPGTDGTNLTETDAAQGQVALIKYFELLSQKKYQEALAYHGSGFGTLETWNPDIPKDDHVALLQNGCEHNGWNCLPINSVVKWAKTGADEYTYTVTFVGRNGGIFKQGPCCGETEGPITSEFDYKVQKQGDKYRVMTEPVYTP